MTEKELEKIFAEIRTEVYSPEYRVKIKEQIKRDNSEITDFALAFATNNELDKVFLFRVLAKALCDKQ